MPPDYIQLTPTNTPPPSTKFVAPSALSLALAEFAEYVYAQTIAEYNRILKLGRQDPHHGESHRDNATGDVTPLRPDPAKQKLTSLQIEVDSIIRRYESHLHKVPDLAAILKPPSEDFSQLIENATGKQTQDFSHVIHIDPRSFDFANLLMFAYDRGWQYDSAREAFQVTSTIGDPGDHGELSFHYDGRAIDVRTKGLSPEQIEYIREQFAGIGVRCYDETIKKNWTDNTTGYHLHFDTATRAEVIQRSMLKKQGGTRIDLGIDEGWPARRP